MNLFGVSQTYYSKIAQEGKIIPDTARFSYNLRASVNISNNAASIRQPDHQAAGIQDIGLNIEGHPHRRTIDFNHFDLRLDLIDQNLFILSVSQSSKPGFLPNVFMSYSGLVLLVRHK